MNIYGKKIMLRAMEPEDMEIMREMVNDPEIERMVGGWSFPVSKHEQMRWYERVVDDKRNLRFIIEDMATQTAVGMISLTDIDWKNREAVYAIKLRSDAPKQQGYATDAMFALLQFAFHSLAMHRLSCEVLEYNDGSLRMNEKCGAQREGLKRSAVYKDGAYHNVICYGVLYEDFQNAAKKAGWSK